MLWFGTLLSIPSKFSKNGSLKDQLTVSDKLCYWSVFNFTEADTAGCPIKQGVLKNFTKFTGKDLCRSLFLKKLHTFRPATLLNRDFEPILKNICERLLVLVDTLARVAYAMSEINTIILA